MKNLKRYKSFVEALKNKAHEYDFSYEDFRDYFIYYSNKDNDDLNFFFDYITKFHQKYLKRLLREFNPSEIFPNNNIDNLKVVFLFGNARICNRKGDLIQEIEMPLGLEFEDDVKAYLKYCFYTDPTNTIKLIYLNYLK